MADQPDGVVGLTGIEAQAGGQALGDARALFLMLAAAPLCRVVEQQGEVEHAA